MYFLGAPSSPVAVGLRVTDVRKAAAFYQQLGFRQVMAVPDESDEWLLCLLRFGNGSILLGALDHPRFPRTSRPERTSNAVGEAAARVELDVPDLVATYAACVNSRCQITAQPARDVWGSYRFSCLDPFGNEWQFTQAAERVDTRPNRAAHDDRMALACQCARIAALI